LEDFPGTVLQTLSGQVPGSLRRGFPLRDAKPPWSEGLRVEPDVRVETQETLSLGEDRTVLAVMPRYDYARRHFSHQLLLPANLDVESIQRSGPEPLDGVEGA